MVTNRTKYNRYKIYSTDGSMGSLYGLFLIHQQQTDETRQSVTLSIRDKQ